MTIKILRLFLIILFATLALCQVIRKGSCPNTRPAKNFDVNKMNGLWFLQYEYYYCPQHNFKCSVINMTTTTINGSEAIKFHENAVDSRDNSLRTRDSIKIINKKTPGVVLSYSIGGCFNDSQTCKYVSTGKDYNFFIIYCCKPYEDNPEFKYETLGIRTRVMKPDGLLNFAIVWEMFNLGLDPQFLLPVKQDCPETQWAIKN